MILVLLTGLQQTWWQKEKTERFFKQELLQKTNDIARTIEPNLVKKLTFTGADTALYEFRLISEILLSYSNIITNVNLYTLNLKDNSLYFGPESSEVGSIHHIQPGTRYNKPQKENFSIFTTGKPSFMGPYSDEYGSFITCLSPVIEPETGKTLMVVGLDILSSTWYQISINSILIPFFSTIIILFLITIWYIYTSKSNKNRQEGKKQYNLSETIFTAIIGSFVTLVFFFSGYRQSKEDNRLLFDLHTENFSKYFRSQLNYISQQSVIVQNFFNASSDVTPFDFRRFTKPIIDENFGLSFAYLKKEELGQNTESLNDSLSKFRIKMVAPDDLKHFPVGYNFSKNNFFKNWTKHKANTDRPITFNPIQLTLNGEHQLTLITISPLYSLYTDKSEDYLVTFTGMQSLLNRLTKTIYHDIPEIDIDLVDISNHNKIIPLANFYPNKSKKRELSTETEYYKEYNLYKVIPFQFMNRSLALVYHPDSNYKLLYQTSYWWLSGTVMAFLTVILTVLILFLQNRETFLNELVAKRTLELESALTKVEQSERLKSSLLLNFSHELRTPLNAILGFSDILTRELNQPEKKQMANHISVMGNRLSITLNSIIKLAQIEADGVRPNITPVLLKPFISSLLYPLKKRADLKNIALKEQIDIEKPILIDVDILGDILYSLTDNAVKFTETGHVWITVTLQNSNTINTKTINAENLSNSLLIIVKDTGIGINESQMHYIFDTFRQGSEGTDRNYEGSGIGLSLTSKLVRLLNGTITVQTNEFEGTTFVVSLPVELAHDEAIIEEQPLVPSMPPTITSTEEPEIPKEENPASKVKGQQIDISTAASQDLSYNTNKDETLQVSEKLNYIKKTSEKSPLASNIYVLLISENQADNILTEHYLVDFCRIDIATSAKLGYKYARQNFYNLIILDTTLKDDNLGIQTLKLLRSIKEYENTPIIAITGYLNFEERQALIDQKVTIAISKPYTKADLISYISKLTENNG